MEDGIKVFRYNKPFKLESGYEYSQIHLGYHTYGVLNEKKDNVIWIFHALTANSDAIDWWHGLVGNGKLFDPAVDFIICVNVPGSCYGSLSPLDKNEKGESFFHNFAFFTTRDIIRSFDLLRQHLGIEKIKVGIGGSMGGQQLLEWAVENPDLFENIVPLATNAVHSAWGVAFNASQRMSIEADQTWQNKNETAGLNGMKVARSIALISYRHYETYRASQSHHEDNLLDNYRSESYQKYQGEKLAKRFNAFSYYFLSKTMDAHNVGRSRESIKTGLNRIKARTLIIGITTDILFPLSEQQFLADNIPEAVLRPIDSLYGHDGFLLEFEQIESIIKNFLTK
ncbi:MAG: homoserine O-acetyltransferase [Ginsengibacter sp.]